MHFRVERTEDLDTEIVKAIAAAQTEQQLIKSAATVAAMRIVAE